MWVSLESTGTASPAGTFAPPPAQAPTNPAAMLAAALLLASFATAAASSEVVSVVSHEPRELWPENTANRDAAPR